MGSPPTQCLSRTSCISVSAYCQKNLASNLFIHRMIEGERELWRSPCALLKQDHLEPAAQDHVQIVFEHPQGWRLHNLLGQPVPVLGDLHSKNPKCSVIFRQTILWSSLYPLHPVLSLDTTSEGLAPSSMHSFMCFIPINKITPEIYLLEAEQSQLLQPFLT